MGHRTKITKSGRVKLEIRYGPNYPELDTYDIYARSEQLDPYFYEDSRFVGHKFFNLGEFLAHLDSYRTCGWVTHNPLDNVRLVKLPPLVPEAVEDDSVEETVNRLNRNATEEKERRRNMAKAKAVGWQIYPPIKKT